MTRSPIRSLPGRGKSTTTAQAPCAPRARWGWRARSAFVFARLTDSEPSADTRGRCLRTRRRHDDDQCPRAEATHEPRVAPRAWSTRDRVAGEIAVATPR